MKKLAFIGLGVMGFPMAGHLAQAGYDVSVYNRSPEKMAAWQQRYTGQAASSVAEVVQDAEVVLACVGNDADVRQITLGDHSENGAFAHMTADSIFIDHTSSSAQLARELNQLATSQQLHFVDAPVSGGQAGAEQGQLTIMTGSDAKIFQAIEPIISIYAKQVRLMGEVGSGQLTKMVNQVCVAGLLQGLAEGLHFAECAGLDAEAVIEVISKGAAQSWQMENRYQTMLADQFDHGFAVQWMRKDLDIVLGEARHNGAQLPVTALVDQFYADIEHMGGQRWDTSSLIKRLRTDQTDIKTVS